MICQSCGKEIPDDSIFCTGCGAKQDPPVEEVQQNVAEDPMKYCTNCGAHIALECRFCPECGAVQETPVEAPKMKPAFTGRQKEGNPGNVSPYQGPVMNNNSQRQEGNPGNANPYQGPVMNNGSQRQDENPGNASPYQGPVMNNNSQRQEGNPGNANPYQGSVMNNGSQRQNANPYVGPKPEKGPSSHKKGKIAGIVVGVILAACGAFIAVSIFMKPTIDLNKYLTVKFDGYNTVGEAEYDLDYEKLNKAYGKKLERIYRKNKKSASVAKPETQGIRAKGIISGIINKKRQHDLDSEDVDESEDVEDSEDYGNMEVSDGLADLLMNAVSGSLDKTSGLSNGDTVKFTWGCNDDYALDNYGFKLKHKDEEFTVQGLKEAETFDPFLGLNVKFSGIAPEGTAKIEGRPTEEAAQEFSYELDKYQHLSNGDTVTVSIYADDYDPVEYCAENYGKIPSPLTKQFAVLGLTSYVQSASEISESDMQQIKKRASEVYKSRVAQDWDKSETLKSMKYLGNYFLVAKPDNDSWNYKNMLYLVYKVKVHDKYSDYGKKYNKTNTIYWFISFSNIVKNANGVLTVNLREFRTPEDRVNIDSGIGSGWFGNKGWYYYGYESLNELYNSVVIANSEYYDSEENMGTESNKTQDEEKSDSEVAMGEDGIIFPNSSDEIIDASAISDLTDEELRYAINEIYARNGYDFRDDSLREYYEKYDWYNPTVEPDDFSINRFNSVEKKNVDTMEKERDSRR